MAAIEFISLLKLVYLGIVMAPRAAAGFRCPEQPVLPPFPCCFSLGCAIAVPGCLLDPSPACAPCSGLWGGVPAGRDTAWAALPFGPCSPSFMELLLVLLERCLHREASVLQFFTESSEMLGNLHTILIQRSGRNSTVQQFINLAIL